VRARRVVIAMVTPHAVTTITTGELHAARMWLAGARSCFHGDAELIAELPPSVVYRALARDYDGGWPRFQRDSQTIPRTSVDRPMPGGTQLDPTRSLGSGSDGHRSQHDR
jgi:hypothetical protein